MLYGVHHCQGPLHSTPILQLSVIQNVGMAASAYHQIPAGVQWDGQAQHAPNVSDDNYN